MNTMGCQQAPARSQATSKSFKGNPLLHYTAAQAQGGLVKGLAVKATTVCSSTRMRTSQLVTAAQHDAAENAHAFAAYGAAHLEPQPQS